MRIVIHGNTNLGYSWFVRTVKEGFTLNGHEVFEIDYKTNEPSKVRDFLYKIAPDVIFTHMTFHNRQPLDDLFEIYHNLRQACDAVVIHTMNDARREPRYSKDISYGFDMALVGQTENINKFSKIWKVPVYYWPYSSQTLSKMAKPDSRYNFDMVYTGSWAHEDRKQFLTRLMQLKKVTMFSTQSNTDKRNETPVLSSSAKCILGLCTGYDLDGFMDVRPFQYLGCGAFMIMRKFKGMDRVIPPDLYAPFDSYNNPKVVVDLFNKWMKKGTKDIRQKAFSFIQEKHSSKARMKQTEDLINGLITELPVFV